MSMTKQDFKLVAEVIRYEIDLSLGEYEPQHIDAYQLIAQHLAKRFAETNPNFNINTFLEACVPADLTAQMIAKGI